MSFPAACCNTPPVQASYTAKGEYGQVGALKCYFAGPADSARALILTYDIFGYHGNVLQLCDILGQAGYRVLLPDFLRGDYLTEADLGKPGVFANFASGRGSWAATKGNLVAARDYATAHGAASVGVVGFCWGGKIVMSALAEVDGLSGGAIVHPAMVGPEDFGKIKVPVLAIPTKDDGDYEEAFKALTAKPFGAKCRLEPFDDMFHGFCGARGDWAVPEQAKRANDAIKLIIGFFGDISGPAN